MEMFDWITFVFDWITFCFDWIYFCSQMKYIAVIEIPLIVGIVFEYIKSLLNSSLYTAQTVNQMKWNVNHLENWIPNEKCFGHTKIERAKMIIDKMLTLADILNRIKDNRSKWPVSNGIKCNKYCDANDCFSLNHPDTKQHHSMVIYWRLSNGHSRSILSKTLWFRLNSPNGKYGDYSLCK